MRLIMLRRMMLGMVRLRLHDEAEDDSEDDDIEDYVIMTWCVMMLRTRGG